VTTYTPGTLYSVQWTDPNYPQVGGYTCPRALYLGPDTATVDGATFDVHTFELQTDTREGIGSTMANAGAVVSIADELLTAEPVESEPTDGSR